MSSLDLFGNSPQQKKRFSSAKNTPLPERMRPEQLSEVVGQRHLLGKGKVLSSAIANDQLSSIIFWGPPGCGKTTLAHVITHQTKAHFEKISALLSGVADLRKIVEKAKQRLTRGQQKTILFIDEIHRFNKAQQDALLSHVEAGTITLIGATTENPSFCVINALLSRASVFTFHPLTEAEVEGLLARAIEDEKKGVGGVSLTFMPEALKMIASHAQGDARRALDLLEASVNYAHQNKIDTLTTNIVETTLCSKMPLYDKDGLPFIL